MIENVYYRQYYWLHREEILRKKRESYDPNKQRLKRQKYKQTERGKQALRIGVKNHRCLKRASGTGIITQQWEDIIRKYNYRCAYCGKRCYLTQDHVIPLSEGGEHSPHNVVPACSECNCRKGTKLWSPIVFKKEA